MKSGCRLIRMDVFDVNPEGGCQGLRVGADHDLVIFSGSMNFHC